MTSQTSKNWHDRAHASSLSLKIALAMWRNLEWIPRMFRMFSQTFLLRTTTILSGVEPAAKARGSHATPIPFGTQWGPRGLVHCAFGFT